MISLFVDHLHGNSKAFLKALESFDPQKKPLNVKSWRLWIQEGPQNQTFCIHHIEAEDPTPFIDTFKEALMQKNSYALFLDDLFTRYLSPSYSLKRSSLILEKVLDLRIDEGYNPLCYDFCYCLPLLPDQVENHKKYCYLAMNEKKESTIAACKTFKMLSMQKWIQDSNYVLYHQKMSTSPKEAREAFLTLKDNPKALLATKTLREQTGLAFEDLCPKVTCFPLFERFN